MGDFWPDGMTAEPIGTWPGPLNPDRRPSSFKAPLRSTMDTLDRELWALAAKDVRLQVALTPEQFRIDGRPRAGARADHPGIILTLQSRYGALSYPCDTFTTWQDNLRAIALALEALRKVDRYGVTKRGEQYRGFLALEATAAPAGFPDVDSAWEYLCRVTDSLGTRRGPGTIPVVLRHAQRLSHPDTGGDATTFHRVSLAEAKLREAGVL